MADNNQLVDRDVQAGARRVLGLPRILELNRGAPIPHPSRGGSRGYPVWFQEDQLWRYLNNLPFSVSQASIRRWIARIHPHRMTGNRESATIIGFEQFLMWMFLVAYPEAQDDEVAAFIAEHTGNIYKRNQISRRKKELGITRKRSSTEANQAFLPRNVLRRERFWTLPPPVGVAGVSRRFLIDIDECGLELDSTNRTHGSTFSGVRVR